MGAVPNWEWNSLLQKEKLLDFFVNISIPAADKRNEKIPNAAIVCQYPRLADFIISEMSGVLQNREIVLQKSLGKQPGDICALFSQLQERTVLFLRQGNCVKNLNKEAHDIFSQAVSCGSVALTLGKGSASRVWNLELPVFTVIAFFETLQEIDKSIRPCFEHVIEIGSLSDEEYCQLEVHAVAKENNMIFDSDSIELIASAANKDYRIANRYVRWIRDYTLVHGEQFSTTPLEYVEKVISLYCLF